MSIMNTPTVLVQKLWNYCNILHDDGLSYGDYVEQLTCLLFLQIADEQAKSPPIPLLPFAEPTPIAAEVVRRLNIVEALETVVSANPQRATRLRQSILQKAFTGEPT